MIMKNISNNQVHLAVPDAIIVISKDRKIITFNKAAERLTGYKFKEIINTDFQILFHNSVKDIDFILSSIKGNNQHINITLNLTTANSTILDVLATITPISQPKVGQLGIIIVFRDMLEMISLQNSLQ